MQAREFGAAAQTDTSVKGNPGAGSFKSKKPLCVIATPDLDLLIAVLNHESVDLSAVKIDHVLRLTPGFLRARPLHFEESEVSEAGERNDCQDERIPPIHVRRDVATR